MLPRQAWDTLVDGRSTIDMMALLIILLVLAVVSLVIAIAQIVRYRRRLYEATGRLQFEISVIDPEDFDPTFMVTDLGPTPASEVLFIGGANRVPNGASDTETWILAALAKSRRTLFEFGTATGKTAYLWARNSPQDAHVTTITLGPEQHVLYNACEGDDHSATRVAIDESTFTQFVYSGTVVEHKITQLFGDSKEFDESPFHRACDLIFVDGSHAYSYVKSDSEKALRMIRPGGVILWHDYRGKWGVTSDVHAYLNELSLRLPLVHLRGTTIVAFHMPLR